MNVIEALNDEALFAPHFRGSTWEAWRAFLAALFALPMDDDALALYRAHTGRQDAPVTPFREAALVIGRRGGKSRILALLGTFLGAIPDYAGHLAAGEVATIGIMAADKRQSRTIFRYVLGLLNAVPMLRGLLGDQTSDTITLTNGVVIEVTTASFRSARGYTYAAILADEVAFWRSEESVNPDAEIIAAVRPGLATIPGSLLLLASSPYRKKGALHAAYTKNFGQDGARVLVWQATSQEMNPALDPVIVAEAYEDDPDAAAAEYGAQFRNDLSDFVSREVVNAATAPGRFEVPPIHGVRYVGFCDPSGGSSDSMTLAIAHKAGERVVLDVVRESRPPFSPETVTMEFAATLKAYGLSRVTGDRYGGEWPRERFRTHGIEYELSDRPKSEIYLDGLPLLNGGRVELLNVPRLAAQLCGLERRTARSGRDSIDHAPGGHDDLANAALGAVLLAAGFGAPRPARWAQVAFMGR